MEKLKQLTNKMYLPANNVVLFLEGHAGGKVIPQPDEFIEGLVVIDNKQLYSVAYAINTIEDFEAIKLVESDNRTWMQCDSRLINFKYD